MAFCIHWLFVNTAHIPVVCWAGSIHCRRQVCCCQPSGHEKSVDCCSAGSQQQLHSSCGMQRPDAGSAALSVYCT